MRSYRSYLVSFDSSVYISKIDIGKYHWHGLGCILETADIEVFLTINSEIFPGHSGSYYDPPESTEVSFNGFCINDFKIYAENSEQEEVIKLLMTKEQKESLNDLCQVLISDNWQKHENKALESFE